MIAALDLLAAEYRSQNTPHGDATRAAEAKPALRDLIHFLRLLTGFFPHIGKLPFCGIAWHCFRSLD